jgi:hypothetical protein
MLDMVPASEKDPVLIVVGVQHDGAVYELPLDWEELIRNKYPGLSLLECVFLGHWRASDFPRLHESRWPRVPELLTGLSLEQFAELNGVRIYSPETNTVVWEWLPSAVKAG